ncbi:hypothetical protein MFLAVUS_005398 [Mucor flavus]|uniref:TEA domain-containing protein n=1 Tax=Mucor flavus TaxID=439312 RepID=A0ABP9YYL1_9FUNG
MLACPQELFFKTDSNTEFNDKRPRQHKMNQLQSMEHVSNKEKEEQQVWPPDVEAAFIKALETIPKLGRRKILVNGKPCGRNELISDFIFRKTTKIRTRKQVSSHIQVLKNTRKGDPHFMRLLTDSVEADEGYVSTQQQQQQHQQQHQIRKTNTKQNLQRRQPKNMNSIHSTDTLSSDESSMSSSPSPADYVFDIMCHDQQNSLSMLDIKDPFYEPFFGMDISNNNNSTNNESMVGGMSSSFSLQNLANATTTDVLQQLFPNEENNAMADIPMPEYIHKQKKPQKSVTKKYNKKQKHIKNSSSMMNLIKNTTMLPTANQTWIDSSVYPLWPNYICLYLEYSLPYDPSITIPHTLASLPECIPNCLPSVDASKVAKGKCPPLHEVTSNFASTTLSAKVKLNLNLNMTDFFFNNTSFFETCDRRTIECTTTIYSFGNVVLESKEIQQALWLNEGKYMYSFVYVNQFFDAFMKGIRSLQSWEEVDIAINNLCVVQVFEDIESKFTHTTSENLLLDSTDGAPLLVMVYEFERGEGTMEMSTVDTFSFLSTTTSVVDL